MDSRKVRQFREVRVYGEGSLGGKGEGLVVINDCDIPSVEKLPTHILATGFYDRYTERDRTFGEEENDVLDTILHSLGNGPIGVRSSATDEGGVPTGSDWSIRAGENISFMLPNNHEDRDVRLRQLGLAVRAVYDHFLAKQDEGDRDAKMAVVLNPVPGLFDDTLAGPFFYPYISGVANSYFPYALKTQDPTEGFARIAFGHGYATVMDDFPVISMATIRTPVSIELLRPGEGQQYFYALDMTRNRELKGRELETMAKLHVRFASFHKIKLLGIRRNVITIEELVQKGHFGFKSGLEGIMEAVSAHIASHFQIEFVFNLDFGKKPHEDGVFHVVQLTRLPEMAFETIRMPEESLFRYLTSGSLQGHGIRRGVKHAVVVSPFLYSREQHDEVLARLGSINRDMRERGEAYLLIVPGRLGSRNREWGICAQYRDVDGAVAIFEYGVDIAGRIEPLPEKDSMTGGIYGSHFLYMIGGGYDEHQRRLQARMYGTQGTHFLTNLMSNNVIYGYLNPGVDTLDAWFFSPPAGAGPIYVLTFTDPVAVYADSVSQCCVVTPDTDA